MFILPEPENIEGTNESLYRLWEAYLGGEYA
jgi:hypothetical protein